MASGQTLCPQCGAENRLEARFCARCGTGLNATATDGAGIAPNAETLTDGGAVEPVTPPEPPPPLPEGTLLNERRYEILAFLGARDGVNEYHAVETTPRKRCPVCHTMNPSDSNFCEQCGGELSAAEAVPFFVRLREAATPTALQAERALFDKELHHPRIAAPLALFTATPYDERHYAVFPAIDGTPLAQVEADDADTALAWARDIAEVFALLNAKGVSLSRPLTEAVIFTDDGTPFLVSDALRPEPGDWAPVREAFQDAVRRWLMGVGAAPLAQRVENLLASANDWQQIAETIAHLLTELHAPPTLRLTVASATDVGRRREHNEDSYWVLQVERCHLDRTETLALLAVADGMGGHAAGEVASRLCLQVFADSLLNAVKQWVNFNDPDWAEALRQAAMEANRQVFAEAQTMRNNMGTTLVAAVVCHSRALFANVGDSRGYIVRDGSLKQVTKDHSYVQQLVDLGMLTPEQARHHPQGNIITRAIGIDPAVEVDIFEIALQKGDIILLCSDGLVDMVDDADIERVLLSEPDLELAAARLVQLANAAGGDDNITVVIARADAV
ncbi:Serine/threonine phosphatase stp [bacterium HR17]|uniref:Serine/threonine phosphatase stp n=1 Tax=Candidatus Fervidibacter japonicus TaxID=2035412 RepID=A0A2H5XAW9_9BACT|nr:Serine/threonine phosphatase stp [bacterium HR17]